jgi:PRTRC genetic system protein E
LTIPVSVSGTAEDLDAQLAGTLVNFASSHVELRNTLERAKANMVAAAKSAQAEARGKSKNLIAKKYKRHVSRETTLGRSACRAKARAGKDPELV